MIIRKRCKWGDNLYMIAIFRIMVVIFSIGRSNCFTIKNFIYFVNYEASRLNYRKHMGTQYIKHQQRCWVPMMTLQWHHNEHDGVSNQQPHDSLLNSLFISRSKLRITGLCVGIHRWPVNSPHKGPVTRKMFPFDCVIMIQCFIHCCLLQLEETILQRFQSLAHEQFVLSSSSQTINHIFSSSFLIKQLSPLSWVTKIMYRRILA